MVWLLSASQVVYHFMSAHIPSGPLQCAFQMSPKLPQRKWEMLLYCICLQVMELLSNKKSASLGIFVFQVGILA